MKRKLIICQKQEGECVVWDDVDGKVYAQNLTFIEAIEVRNALNECERKNEI